MKGVRIVGEAKRRRDAAGGGTAYAEAARDRAVQRLLDRAKRGLPVAFAEMVNACPYRTLLTFNPTPNPQPTRYVVQAGFGPVVDFSAERRDRIVAMLQAGENVMIYSNRRDICDHVERVIITLAASAPQGRA
jgi:hypothetical protein